MYQVAYTCPKTKSGARKKELACANEFAAQHQPPLILHTTKDNGDCLFDSLAQFGEHMKYAPLQQDQNSIRQGEDIIVYLRRKLVEYALNHIEDIYESFEQNGVEPEDKILGLLKPGTWFSEMGDIAPQIIPFAFRMNILLYNLSRTDEKNNNNKYPPDLVWRSYFEYQPDAPTIILLRIYDGHYQWFSVANSSTQSHSPLRVASAASSRFNNENQKLNLQNQLNSLSASMGKMSLSKTRSRKPAVKVNINPNTNKSMYRKKSITRKKKETNKAKSRTPQYNHYQFLINEMKKMNNNSTNKQNSIIYLSRSILNDPDLSINNKNELMQQFES